MLPLALVILTGCPGDSGGDDDAGTSDSETGREIPQDPLDDDGAEPPGDPDVEEQYPSPSTLGNGLVHDTRYLLGNNADQVQIPSANLDDGVPWNLADHETMLEVGFRPAQIHAEISLTESMGISTVTIEDDSVYISDDDSNYLYRVETYIFESQADEKNKSSFGPVSDGFRPIAIDVVNVPTDLRDEFGFTVAWVYDDSSVDWKIITPPAAERVQ